MIDIHCHLIYGVDDGAESIEEAAQMLENAAKQQIAAIILTPHCRHGMFRYPKETIDAHFEELQPLAAEFGIRLALGTEYHADSGMVDAFASGRCRTLAGSSYVLAEFSGGSPYEQIYGTSGELIRHGYIPVVAHAERYACLVRDISRVEELRRLGAWVQLNADAVLGMEGFASKRFCGKLIKRGLADVVASDSHGMERRACHLGMCRDYLAKKYGSGAADRLLDGNPSKIWNNDRTAQE